MKVSAKQYAQVLLDIIVDKEGKDLDVVIKDFSALLKKNNQLNQIDKILYHFNSLYNKKYNILEAQINSAHDLEDAILLQVKEYLNNINKKENLEFKIGVDKSIIGGLVIKYGDKIIDASLKTRLKQLKNSLLK